MNKIRILHDDVYVTILVDGKLIMSFEEGRELDTIKRVMQISREFSDYEIEEPSENEEIDFDEIENHELYSKYI